MGFYLGIDAGGSKTECAVADEHDVLARFTGATCKIQRVGVETATATLRSVVQSALSAATIPATDIDRACIGISGASQRSVVDWSKQTLASLIPGQITVVGDNVIAHESAFHGGAGVLLIAGTGSIAYGRNEKGEVARAGGWGPVVSDEGSGDWIGRTAINAALRSLDRGQRSALVATVLEAWKASSYDDIVRLSNGSPPPDFAALFPRVLAAADGGDASALEVLNAAGTELARLALAVMQKLWPDDKSAPVQVAAAGGVLTNSPQIREAVHRGMRAERPRAAIGNQIVDPIIGALYLARHAELGTSNSV
ncbi:MAG: ATPase BadF/BadG/BcrA/BcrD type [Acidobacteriales bacterium]|nr:ATPase BadF/BadG/BcrA/BcrD type [Terriglobales bacterium]